MTNTTGTPLADIAAVRRRLHEQEAALASLVSRMSSAQRELVPLGIEDHWRGNAQFFYALCVLSLRAQVQGGLDSLESALRETRRALDSLESRAW